MLEKVGGVSKPFYEVVRDNLYHSAEWDDLREMYIVAMLKDKIIEYNFNVWQWLQYIVEIPEKQIEFIRDTQSSIILEGNKYEWKEYKDWHFVKFKI